MNPNEKDLLEKTYRLVDENNHILKGIRNTNRWAAAIKFFYWIVVIGISVGAFYYIQPYTDKLFNTYQSIQRDLNNVKSVVNSIPRTN